jgi:hypothetical protein
MKLHDRFKTFLQDHVNLNDTRLTLLSDSVDAVKRAIRASEWEPTITGFAEQGSWAHETIIKPLPGRPFDADLLVFVEPVSGWTARDYVYKLAAEMRSIPAYKDKITRYSHCVTIEYAGDRKIDIAPCVVARHYQGQFEVCDSLIDEFQTSEPLAYTQWVNDKNSIAGGNDLRKATRLLKYLRDIKGNFTCPSFLLTTLLGYQINDDDRHGGEFSDLTTSLKTLVDRLDDWLQARPSVPHVENPVLYGENQADGWDETKYLNFRNKINLYREWIDDAFDETDVEESIGKWRRVFGDNFASNETKRAAESISESVARSSELTSWQGTLTDLVGLVRSRGLSAVPAIIHKLPHIQRTKWRQASQRISVNVTAALKREENSAPVRNIRSGEPLQAGYWIKFTASDVYGTAFTKNDFFVEWRITNTDKVAAAADQLRGDFYHSDQAASRTEHLAYRGVHFVEAFVIRRRDDRQVGQSQPFYVVIE